MCLRPGTTPPPLPARLFFVKLSFSDLKFPISLWFSVSLLSGAYKKLSFVLPVSGVALVCGADLKSHLRNETLTEIGRTSARCRAECFQLLLISGCLAAHGVGLKRLFLGDRHLDSGFRGVQGVNESHRRPKNEPQDRPANGGRHCQKHDGVSGAGIGGVNANASVR